MLLQPAAQIHKPERRERRAAGGCMAVGFNVYGTLAKATHNLSKAKKAEFNLILLTQSALGECVALPRLHNPLILLFL